MEKQEPEKVDPQRKEQLLSYIKMMAAIALVLGIASVIIGIVVFVYLGGGNYPITSGVGIWYGLSPIIFGVMGLGAAFTNDEKTQMNMLNGHYIMSIVIVSMGYAMAATIQGLVSCALGEEKCGTNTEIQTALHGVLTGIIVTGYALAISSMVIHLKNKNTLHPDWKKRRGCCGNQTCD